MPITMITRYSGNEEAIQQAARANGPLILKYGAKESRLLRISTGPHIGQYVLLLRYDSYADMESTQARLLQDPSYVEAFAALRKAAVVEDRTIYADVPT